MADSASQPDGAQFAIVVEIADDTKHGVGFDQLKRYCRVIEIHFTVLDRIDYRCWQSGGIHFQSERQSIAWSESVNRLVESQLIAPECLVSKGVESKNLFSFFNHFVGVVLRIAEDRMTRSLRGPEHEKHERNQRHNQILTFHGNCLRTPLRLH